MVKRVALVTGSTSGIGLAIARCLAKRGDDVILTGLGDDDVIKSLIEDFSSQYKGKTHYIFADLTKAEDIEKMCEEIKELYPDGIDILVNNAGFQHVSPVEEFSTEKWDAMIAVMLSAPFHFIKHLLPDMKRKGWGRIINISSAHGLAASPNKSAYVTCKHGILGLTKVIALETAGTGVTCNAICPGYVNTPILQAQVTTLAENEGLTYKEAEEKFVANFLPSKQLIEVDHLAETALFLCSDAASQITGSPIVMDGGWTAR